MTDILNNRTLNIVDLK